MAGYYSTTTRGRPVGLSVLQFPHTRIDGRPSPNRAFDDHGCSGREAEVPEMFGQFVSTLCVDDTRLLSFAAARIRTYLRSPEFPTRRRHT